jgi:hypothetical protein
MNKKEALSAKAAKLFVQPNADQVSTQVKLLNNLKTKYYSVAPSSYAPVVETDRETTYRFYVHKSEWGAGILVEEIVPKPGNKRVSPALS